MKNREKYKNELIQACKDADFNVFFNKYIVPAYRCGTYGGMTEEKRMLLTILWLDEEYKEEQEVCWSKVNVDDPILVRDGDEEWNRAHFACYKDGKVYAWSGGRTRWTASSYIYWEQAKLAEPQKPEHDSCAGCKFEHFEEDQEPCKDCQYTYMDRYEPQE